MADQIGAQDRPVMVFDTTGKVVDDPLPEVRKVLETLPQIMMMGG